MKKKAISMLLAATMALSLTACGGGTSTGSNADAGSADAGTESSDGASTEVDASAYLAGGDEGKVINIYSWNDEFRLRLESVYSEVDKTSDSLIIVVD